MHQIIFGWRQLFSDFALRNQKKVVSIQKIFRRRKNQKSEVILNLMNRFRIFMPGINSFLAMVVSKMNSSCILMALIKLTRNK